MSANKVTVSAAERLWGQLRQHFANAENEICYMLGRSYASVTHRRTRMRKAAAE
jgi:hypothetical protein